MARQTGSYSTRSPAKSARQKAWNAMRVHKMFDALTLEISAGISESNLQVYLRVLHRVGYVRQVRPKQNGKNGGCVIWRLVKYTGPRAPIVRQGHTGVYDPNLDQFIPVRPVEPKKEAAHERLPTAHPNLAKTEAPEESLHVRRQLA